MILVHIITKCRSQALEIVDILLDRKLILNAMLSRKKVYHKKKNSSEIIATTKTLITGKTRALLYNNINTILTEIYGETDQMPSICAIPIIFMDPKSNEQLLDQTLEI